MDAAFNTARCQWGKRAAKPSNLLQDGIKSLALGLAMVAPAANRIKAPGSGCTGSVGRYGRLTQAVARTPETNSGSGRRQEAAGRQRRVAQGVRECEAQRFGSRGDGADSPEDLLGVRIVGGHTGFEIGVLARDCAG